MEKRVYFAGCDSYQFEQIKAVIDRMFESLGWASLVPKGGNVVIKPNLVMKSNPDTAIITHPMVVAAVGVKIQELGGKVTIAESSGGLYTPATLKSSYQTCGYTEIAQRYGFTLNYDCSYRQVEVPDGIRSKSFSIIEPLLTADLIVDIAKLKSHCMTGLSGAVKNMFGAVPGLMKPELHCRFPEKPAFGEMLTDLCSYLNPRICIVDAILAMEGNGPTGGKPRKVGALFGGSSAFCTDLVSCKLINMLPRDIEMLRSAIERGLCPETMEELELLGEPVEPYVLPDFLQPESKSNDFLTRIPKVFQPVARKLMTPRPKIRTKDCVGCGKCAESCPKHTITIENRKAVIHYGPCIKCYCCHEMCPMQAVDIQRFSLFSLRL